MDEKTIKTIIGIVALIAMIAGVIGALLCTPFVLASDIVNVVGAGFGILIGSVLFGSGLITLAILSSNK